MSGKMKKMLVSILALTMLFGSFAGTADAADTKAENVMQLSLQDAIDIAMENNDSIKNAKLNLENADLEDTIQRQSYAESFIYGPQGSSYALDATLYTTKIYSVKYEIYSATYDLTKESVEVGVKQLYWNALLQEAALESKEAAVELAENQLRVANLQKTVGMMTTTGVMSAEVGVESAKSALLAAQDSVTNAKDSLKLQLGVSPSTEIVLTDGLPEFVPIDIDDLTYFTNKKVMNSPSLKIADYQITIADYTEKATKLGIAVKAMTGVTYSQEYSDEQAEINGQTVRLSKETTEKNLRNTISTLYNDALEMETNYAVALSSMETAEAALATQQQLYDLGMATNLSVLSARNTCLGLEYQYSQLLVGHARDALLLEHPWCSASR